MSFDVLLYIELTIPFLIGRKRTVNFEISACDVISADYTIIMLRTPKVTGSHVKFARFVLFASVKKPKNMTSIFFVQCVIKQLLDSVFVICRIIKPR